MGHYKKRWKHAARGRGMPGPSIFPFCLKKNLHMTTAVRTPVAAAACCGIKYWGSH
ncbi:protein of unknown function [Cupriavidus taiwanensis]|uniref:Uncharacterized protein n=1 Tax=Cupriavidus taiwanensis TaxID=164546 RepID=A0A375IDQ8_9BURK|nr:hypothetical protein CBM2622_A140078 [Cupriavidus taiwanensis]SPK72208.1 protein of unknown function [Cupriavidus taiwanensis]